VIKLIYDLCIRGGVLRDRCCLFGVHYVSVGRGMSVLKRARAKRETSCFRSC